MQQTGNTVCIEHGLGLKTWYYHMSSLSAQVGRMVKKGDEIGRVGTTGYSNGFHLHFAMTVYGAYVDPLQLMDQSIYDQIVFW